MLFKLALKVAVRVAVFETVHGLVVPVQLPVLLLPVPTGTLHPPKPNAEFVPVTGVAVNCT
jgi:hypothetical protein